MIASPIKSFAAAALTALVAGCAGSSAPPSPQASASAPAPTRMVSLSSAGPDAATAGEASHEPPRDAAGPVRQLFRIDVYQFTAPIGSLGRNEDFWKHIDEQCVDVGTYDLLFKNGLRIGVAPMSEFDGIRKHIGEDASCHAVSVTGSVAKQVQLETRKDLMKQTIFHFDQSNNLVGRSYDRCTNLLNLSFEPTPRKTGSVRVKLCPMVRANRTQLEFSVLNDEREIQYVSPEIFYDLNVRADVAPDQFLILAPSADADRSTSVGHAFLTQDGSTQPLEQVIVLVPQPLNAEDPLSAVRPPHAQASR